MPRYALRLAFNGKHFSGTAPQPEQPSLVDHVRRAISALQGGHGGERVRTCGRLDAGVSASTLVVDVDMEREWAPADLARALTSHLQPSTAVRAIARVADDWDALRHCIAKTYCYRIYESPVPPVLERHCWWLRHLPHAELLNDCAQALVGRRDLAGFAARRNDGTDDGNPVRLYQAADWRCGAVSSGEGGTMWQFRITGEGFLYKQVRGLVGAMVAVAREKATFNAFMQTRDAGAKGERVGQMAPAQGLLLEQVWHDPEPAWVVLS